ncbi:MAG: Rieske 2Fe-2S domain-containing protein [bacterium]
MLKFHNVFSLNELPVGTMKMVVLENKEILISNVTGTIHAISNRCTHLGGSLVKGKLEGQIVTCPRHGAKFDVTSGEAVGPAKILMLKMNVKNEQIFPVKIEADQILVGIEAL